MEFLTNPFEQFSVVGVLIYVGLGALLTGAAQYVFGGLTGRHERRRAARNAFGRYLYPLLRSADSLDKRIQNYVAFADQGWFDDPDDAYYRTSTLYVIGRYFGWCKLLEEDAFLDLEPSRRRARRFRVGFFRVYKGLTGHQYFKGTEIPGRHHANVPRFAIQAVAELMLDGEGDSRTVLSFVEFDRRFGEDPAFAKWFGYFERLLGDAHPGREDARWNRVAVFGANVRAFVMIAGRNKVSRRTFALYLREMDPRVAARVKAELCDEHLGRLLVPRENVDKWRKRWNSLRPSVWMHRRTHVAGG